jgi:transposase-like protein
MLRSAYPPGGDPLDFPDTPQGPNGGLIVRRPLRLPGTMATVEVITSVERRRRWSREAKLRIVAESARPDCTVSQVARAHDIAPGQLFTWRRELLAAAIESHGSEGDRGDSQQPPLWIARGPASAGPFAAAEEDSDDSRPLSGLAT